MPPRKRSRQTAFRLGMINAAGGRPLVPQKVYHRSVVAQQFGTSAGTTAGDHISFSIGSWNTPLNPANNTTWVVPVGISGVRHPSGHVDLLADKYDSYRVTKGHYHITIDWRGANRAQSQWYFMYKFDNDETTATPALPNTVATTEVMLDIMASSGWQWRRFSCLSAQEGYLPSGGIIDINVPNVVELTMKHNESTLSDLTVHDLNGLLADSTNVPNTEAFLHIIVLVDEKDGIAAAMNLNDIVMIIRLTQSVTVWQDQTSVELVDPGDDAP